MLTVVTFKWSKPGYRSKFEGSHVDTLYRMVKRNYRHKFRFVCITDDDSGINEPEIEIFSLWEDFRHVDNPSGRRNPSCYRRLRIFAANAGEWLGSRIVALDLDTVITGDMGPVWNRKEDFVIWGDTNHSNPYNGSMVLFTAGARPHLWEEFDPDVSPGLARAAGFFGSDQAWFAYRLGPNETKWNSRDGVYSFRNHILPRRSMLPGDARVVFFHGRHDPWQPATQRLAPWIKEHYR